MYVNKIFCQWIWFLWFEYLREMSLFIWSDPWANERQRWLQTEAVRNWFHKFCCPLHQGQCGILTVRHNVRPLSLLLSTGTLLIWDVYLKRAVVLLYRKTSKFNSFSTICLHVQLYIRDIQLSACGPDLSRQGLWNGHKDT